MPIVRARRSLFQRNTGSILCCLRSTANVAHGPIQMRSADEGSTILYTVRLPSVVDILGAFLTRNVGHVVRGLQTRMACEQLRRCVCTGNTLRMIGGTNAALYIHANGAEKGDDSEPAKDTGRRCHCHFTERHGSFW